MLVEGAKHSTSYHRIPAGVVAELVMFERTPEQNVMARSEIWRKNSDGQADTSPRSTCPILTVST